MVINSSEERSKSGENGLPLEGLAGTYLKEEVRAVEGNGYETRY